MKRFFSPKLIVAGATFCAAVTLLAQALTRYESQSGSKIKIEGSSTIHDWTVEGGIIAGYIEMPADFVEGKTMAVGTKLKPNLQVDVPVRSLKSGKKAMDNIMYEAMKMQANPKIEYRLLDLSVKSAPAKPGDPYQLDAKGTLKVAGVTRTNQMVVSMAPLDKTRMKFNGVTSVKMTDFGIKPPAPEVALGLIKTSDDVKLTFDWVTAQKAATTAKAN